jgi:hypothetical protein
MPDAGVTVAALITGALFVAAGGVGVVGVVGVLLPPPQAAVAMAIARMGTAVRKVTPQL